MQRTVTKVEHYSSAIPNQVGEGARVIGALRDAGVSAKQPAFFLNGDDYHGAVAATPSNLVPAGINVGAVQAVCGGKGRYGAVLFLPQASVRRAAKALGVS
jgi:hypothetical protein